MTYYFLSAKLKAIWILNNIVIPLLRCWWGTLRVFSCQKRRFWFFLSKRDIELSLNICFLFVEFLFPFRWMFVSFPLNICFLFVKDKSTWRWEQMSSYWPLESSLWRWVEKTSHLSYKGIFVTKMQKLNEYLSNARWKYVVDYYLSRKKMQGILTVDLGIPGSKSLNMVGQFCFEALICQI